jgi:hypothetical protein
VALQAHLLLARRRLGLEAGFGLAGGCGGEGGGGGGEGPDGEGLDDVVAPNLSVGGCGLIESLGGQWGRRAAPVACI